jgi:penicillin amidase
MRGVRIGWPRTWPGRLGLGAVALVVVLALVVSVVAVWAVRRPFPTHDGELRLAGLSGPVTVHRDAHGIPQVYAESAEDLFRAQGFVHAQDRFWEMDFRRHVTAGRLAEWFGQSQVETDTFLRTQGWRRVAEAEWELVSPEARRFLTAYAEGVNAWIEATGGPAATGRKALQYRLLGLQRSGYEIEPWHPVDSLAWLKAMAWDLRGNMESEIERATLLASGLTRTRIDQLFPPYPYDEHTPIVSAGTVVDGVFVPDGGAPAGPTGGDQGDAGGTGGGLPGTGGLPDDLLADRLAAAAPMVAAVGQTAAGVPELLGPAGAGLGSNSWVVSGDLTTTGAPILVNDPHLSVSMPGIWYQMGLHCDCGYRVSGFTFSGVPGVVIGHNERIAWGFTNLNPDVTDLFLERVDGDRYLLDGRWRDLEVHEETVRVAGGEDVTIRVRRTHRGPLVSDASVDLAELSADGLLAGNVALESDAAAGGPGGYGLSLGWTALRPGRTVEALFVINQAGGWDDFRAAAELFEVPAQNLIYADVDGNIGYQAPGRVPVRGAGDGRWVAPGWDSDYDWQGFIPFDQLPHVLNPEDGIVVTANQAVVGPQYQPLLTTDFGFGYRGNRIHELIAEATTSGPLDVPTMERMLFDNRHNFAPELVPALLSTPTAPLSRDERAALDLLRGWDFQQPAGGEPGSPRARSSAAAAYFNAVWRHLLMSTFDELPEDYRPFGSGRWFLVIGTLLEDPASPWWDRTDTAQVETRDEVVAGVLAEAYRELALGQGDDPAGWRWGAMHTLTLRDATFGGSGIGPVEAMFNRGPVGTAGGTDIVNATSWNAADGYEVVVAPSMRMIVDMSDLDGSRWVQLTGNSAHAYHPNYQDQLELWRTGEMLPWRWDRAAVEDGAVATLTLTP